MNKNINFGELKGTVLSKSELKEVKYISNEKEVVNVALTLKLTQTENNKTSTFPIQCYGENAQFVSKYINEGDVLRVYYKLNEGKDMKGFQICNVVAQDIYIDKRATKQ